MLTAEQEAAVELLSSCDETRVLRRFVPRTSYGTCADPKIGLVVDCETTGLDTADAKIIQFSGVRFQFDSTGQIGDILSSFSAIEDPGEPLDPTVVALTGLTDGELRGKKIDDKHVDMLLNDVVLVISHNASFDRPIIERRFRGFEALPWGCSQREVNWFLFGATGMKLDYLVTMLCGEYHAAHNALDDCHAAIHLLATPRVLPGGRCLCASESMTGDDGCPVHGEPQSPFQMLLDSVRTPTHRVLANSAPFPTKDKLKIRKYQWNGDAKVWWKDVKQDDLAAEHEWLGENIYGPGRINHSTAKKVSARDRYSVRCS